MRILLHPGFHKTGTSSLQRGAMARADDLAPHLRVLLTPDIIKAARAARRYSTTRSPDLLARFSDHFQTSITSQSRDDPRALLISSEDLGGALPGLSGVGTYDAAPDLMLAASSALRAHFGAQAQITIWFTTRETGPWLKSLYWQNLRAHRLVDDFETFRDQFAPAADMGRIVTNTRAAIGDQALVTATALETIAQHRAGPLGAALDLLDIPSQTLAPLGAHNLQPADAADALLALNRSEIDDASLKDAKRELLRMYRRNRLA